MGINPYFKKFLIIPVYLTDFLAESLGSSLLLSQLVADKKGQ